MRVTHLGHACLLVELADTRILIDPGSFSRGFDEVRDLDAIVITHRLCSGRTARRPSTPTPRARSSSPGPEQTS